MKKFIKNASTKLTYTQFIKHLGNDIDILYNGTKQQKSNSKIKTSLLELFQQYANKKELYPILETTKGFIREDFIINAITRNFKNVHIFASNPPYVQQYENSKRTIIIVVKRTHQGIYSIPTKNVIDTKLSLGTMFNIKGIKQLKSLSGLKLD